MCAMCDGVEGWMPTNEVVPTNGGGCPLMGHGLTNRDGVRMSGGDGVLELLCLLTALDADAP